jgi:hypothetical protein
MAGHVLPRKEEGEQGTSCLGNQLSMELLYDV